MSDIRQPVRFVDRAEALLGRLESAIDRLADDLDIDVLRAGNVITLEFDNGHRIIINSQEAAEEVWVAARCGGFHYRWRDDVARWTDTRSDDDLNLALSKLIAIETGVTPALTT